MKSELTQEDTDEAPPPRWLFTRRIDAGHVMQAAVNFVIGAAFLVGIYIFILGRLGDHDGKLQLLDQAVRANKEYITRVDDAQRLLSSELRQKLDKVIDMIGDIRERQGVSAPGGSRR